ncbi:hypothetical protein JYQ62_21700 [Nostoc sp. UHCC 0702]|nr:hypothetical protein JYQ62_21700 [Nostoc sp. UHCC 0702]
MSREAVTFGLAEPGTETTFNYETEYLVMAQAPELTTPKIESGCAKSTSIPIEIVMWAYFSNCGNRTL